MSEQFELERLVASHQLNEPSVLCAIHKRGSEEGVHVAMARVLLSRLLNRYSFGGVKMNSLSSGGSLLLCCATSGGKPVATLLCGFVV